MVQSTPPPTSIHPQVCPHCGLTPVSAAEYREGMTVTISYMCLSEHVWLIKFLSSSGAAA